VPHELNIENDGASMMYVGEVPWHGLGTRLETAPKTAQEAIRAANLDWEVGLKPVYCMQGSTYYEIPEKKAIVRLDKWGQPDCVPFGLVGNDYQPLQNREAFQFFDKIVATGKVSYETAGALGNGERVWVLAKVAGELTVSKVDKIDKYLLLSTGHDGKTAIQIRFTPVRVVCKNTLVRSMSEGTEVSRIYHVPGMQNRFDKAQGAVESIFAQYDKLAANFQAMAGKQLAKLELGDYLAEVFPEPKRKKGQTERSYLAALQKVREMRTDAETLFTKGMGNDQAAIRGSLWAAYNGVIELVDHHWPYKTPWQRFQSVCFGEGEHLKEKAFGAALAIIQAAA
jgi:phage/plasmid-like protein (TIGR03299 family)